MQVTSEHLHIPLDRPFIISRGVRTHCDIIQVTVEYNEYKAVGECSPTSRYGESIESVLAEIESFGNSLGNQEPKQARLDLQKQPAGAARNALDCALWSLEAQINGTAFPAPYFDIDDQIETAMTVSIDQPKTMAEQAKEYIETGATLLKVKLDSELIIERLTAVRDAAPSCKIVVDANEAWAELNLEELFQQLTCFNITMIEQPVPSGDETLLKNIKHPIPLCADESCHTAKDIPSLVDCYEMINIKLDKTGGLTEALKLEQAAHENGLEVMVGCMVGTATAMKAALPIATRASVVDLDGPVLIGERYCHDLKYKAGHIQTQ
ncbi:dipeptide epimerase [Vibrio marisflavi]|uniref:Dipeptide epimerase n=1 Tax=Vibrio marisflavi CECT 7928 TaxID=634439 RepID=A0ABM8ZZE3_9VIBR|nr:dipeptide epimerase [Vibrio marisflavi]CAH0536283.1 L-Ala-D/L-Glu epimerase [Vibrio marisflavi CECT 7928]